MKKAQLQMGETIFVVIIILFLIIIGMVFLYGHEEESIFKSEREFYELDSVALGQLITNLPELACSVAGTKQQSCFDKSKVESFSKILYQNSDIAMEYYFEKLGNVNITIEEVYPEEGKRWEIYVNNFDINYTDTDLGMLIQSYGTTLKIPILIKDPTTNKNSFGILYVTKYRKI